MEIINHFSHRHGLSLMYKHGTCGGCLVEKRSDFYCCKRGYCGYQICKSCFDLPREIPHPFHREHPLTLLIESPYESGFFCNACNKKGGGYGFIFNCSECKFDLDINCATLMPCDEKQQITHRSFIPCYRKNKDVVFQCSVCNLPIKNGTIYVSLYFRVILDQWCRHQLTYKITHHFHPLHSLTLNLKPSKKGCGACGHACGRFSYNCSECKFDLDVRCASLIPKPMITKSYDDDDDDDDQSLQENQLQEVVQVVPFTHPHALISCVTNGNFTFPCSACETSIEGDTVYVCLQCRYFLHKSCAELQREIKHPFHPPHPLVLHDNKDDKISCECDACERPSGGFKYRCATCNFAMDTICASLRPTVKFQLHQHPLVFFINNREIRFEECSVHGDCSGHQLSFPYFRCVPCNFKIDLFRLPTLPLTFKHTNHRHSLTLTYSPIKDHSDDDSDSEYYCDVCEDRRQLKNPTYCCEQYHYVLPTYYCEECHYVAHLSCAFKEILPLLETEWTDQEILMLQEELDARTAKLETLIKKLDELKERHAQHIGEYHQIDDPAIVEPDEGRKMLQAGVDALKTKLETVKTKLDEFKERRAQHIGDYEIGVTKPKTRSSSIAKPDKEIVMLQAEVDALTTELETLTTNFDELKERRPQRLGGNQIESNEDEDEESDGTCSTHARLDEKAITSKLEALKKKCDGQIEVLTLKLKIRTLELEALKKEIDALTTKLEALKKKRISISSSNEKSL